jgi:hypothetical protein
MYLTVGLVVLLYSVAIEGHNECTGTLLHWMCCFVVQCCQRGYLSQWMYRYIVTLDVLFCCTVLPTRVSVTMNVQVHCCTGCVVLLYSFANEGICHNECTGTLLHWMCCFVVQCCQGICHNECTGTLLHWMCCFVVQCCQRGYLSQWMYRYIVTLDVLFCCTVLPGYLPQWMYRYIVTLDVLFCCTVLPTRVSVTMNVQVHCYTGCVVLLYSVANEGICHNECTGTLLHWMCCFVVHCYQRGYLSQWTYRYIVTLNVLFCWTVLPTRVSVTMNVQVHCYTGCVVLLYSVANEGIYHNECTGTLLHWMCCFVVQGICLNECTGTLLHWMSCFAKLPMWI